MSVRNYFNTANGVRALFVLASVGMGGLVLSKLDANKDLGFILGGGGGLMLSLITLGYCAGPSREENRDQRLAPSKGSKHEIN